MTNSELFKKAHAMTRDTIAKHPGSDYQLTFGAAMKAIREANAMKRQLNIKNFLYDALEFSALSAFFAVFMMVALYLTGHTFGNVETANMGVYAGATTGIVALIYSLANAYDMNMHSTKG